MPGSVGSPAQMLCYVPLFVPNTCAYWGVDLSYCGHSSNDAVEFLMEDLGPYPKHNDWKNSALTAPPTSREGYTHPATTNVAMSLGDQSEQDEEQAHGKNDEKTMPTCNGFIHFKDTHEVNTDSLSANRPRAASH
eukprot:NODE_22427_length_708_cov_18.657487.p1 GENE.NODE_22427_length_708_cov_18.657487~~NODE_22427_length_708_cov_18.657487.p1  ORF type:complete len:135 (-),score=19.12 NODE_22427_length_708_cov_18.657487:303-707(-)